MEISGTVKKIFDPQTKGSFTFREMVITTDEQYPQDILIQFVQDKIELLNLYKPGDTLKIFINIRGREWISPQGEIKYFNTISGWKIERINSQSMQNFDQKISENIELTPSVNLEEDDEEDLPF